MISFERCWNAVGRSTVLNSNAFGYDRVMFVSVCWFPRFVVHTTCIPPHAQLFLPLCCPLSGFWTVSGCCFSPPAVFSPLPSRSLLSPATPPYVPRFLRRSLCLFCSIPGSLVCISPPVPAPPPAPRFLHYGFSFRRFVRLVLWIRSSLRHRFRRSRVLVTGHGITKIVQTWRKSAACHMALPPPPHAAHIAAVCHYKVLSALAHSYMRKLSRFLGAL